MPYTVRGVGPNGNRNITELREKKLTAWRVTGVEQTNGDGTLTMPGYVLWSGQYLCPHLTLASRHKPTQLISQYSDGRGERESNYWICQTCTVALIIHAYRGYER